MDPWKIELLVVDGGVYSSSERRSISRDVAAGRRTRVRPRVYADRGDFDRLDERDRHVVQMRALAAVCVAPPVFSHWSAAVLHGLPFLGDHLDRVHVQVESDTSALRGLTGVAGHVVPARGGVLHVERGLLATDTARTVVDIASSVSFSAGVVVADAALLAGVPRWMLDVEVDLVTGRRGASRAAGATRFGHPGAESAAESVSRCTEFRMGIPPLLLQHVIRDGLGYVGSLDQYSREADAGCEIDGRRKYLDPEIAKDGAAAALLDEKDRQDRMLLEIARMARWGWSAATSPALLGPILAKVGILPDRSRATFDHYAELAAVAVPRRPAQRWVPTRPSATGAAR